MACGSKMPIMYTETERPTETGQAEGYYWEDCDPAELELGYGDWEGCDRKTEQGGTTWRTTTEESSARPPVWEPHPATKESADLSYRSYYGRRMYSGTVVKETVCESSNLEKLIQELRHDYGTQLRDVLLWQKQLFIDRPQPSGERKGKNLRETGIRVWCAGSVESYLDEFERALKWNRTSGPFASCSDEGLALAARPHCFEWVAGGVPCAAYTDQETVSGMRIHEPSYGARVVRAELLLYYWAFRLAFGIDVLEGRWRMEVAVHDASLTPDEAERNVDAGLRRETPKFSCHIKVVLVDDMRGGEWIMFAGNDACGDFVHAMILVPLWIAIAGADEPEILTAAVRNALGGNEEDMARRRADLVEAAAVLRIDGWDSATQGIEKSCIIDTSVYCSSSSLMRTEGSTKLWSGRPLLAVRPPRGAGQWTDLIREPLRSTADLGPWLRESPLARFNRNTAVEGLITYIPPLVGHRTFQTYGVSSGPDGAVLDPGPPVFQAARQIRGARVWSEGKHARGTKRSTEIDIPTPRNLHRSPEDALRAKMSIILAREPHISRTSISVAQLVVKWAEGYTHAKVYPRWTNTAWRMCDDILWRRRFTVPFHSDGVYPCPARGAAHTNENFTLSVDLDRMTAKYWCRNASCVAILRRGTRPSTGSDGTTSEVRIEDAVISIDHHTDAIIRGILSEFEIQYEAIKLARSDIEDDICALSLADTNNVDNGDGGRDVNDMDLADDVLPAPQTSGAVTATAAAEPSSEGTVSVPDKLLGVSWLMTTRVLPMASRGAPEIPYRQTPTDMPFLVIRPSSLSGLPFTEICTTGATRFVRAYLRERSLLAFLDPNDQAVTEASEASSTLGLECARIGAALLYGVILPAMLLRDSIVGTDDTANLPELCTSLESMSMTHLTSAANGTPLMAARETSSVATDTTATATTTSSSGFEDSRSRSRSWSQSCGDLTASSLDAIEGAGRTIVASSPIQQVMRIGSGPGSFVPFSGGGRAWRDPRSYAKRTDKRDDRLRRSRTPKRHSRPLEPYVGRSRRTSLNNGQKQQRQRNQQQQSQQQTTDWDEVQVARDARLEAARIAKATFTRQASKRNFLRRVADEYGISAPHRPDDLVRAVCREMGELVASATENESVQSQLVPWVDACYFVVKQLFDTDPSTGRWIGVTRSY